MHFHYVIGLLRALLIWCVKSLFLHPVQLAQQLVKQAAGASHTLHMCDESTTYMSCV
jgi:hypothetical protein